MSKGGVGLKPLKKMTRGISASSSRSRERHTRGRGTKNLKTSLEHGTGPATYQSQLPTLDEADHEP